MEPERDDLCQFVVQPRVVLSIRVIRYNVPCAIGLYFDGFSGADKTKDMSGTEDMKETSSADGVMVKCRAEATMVKSNAEDMMVKGRAGGVLAKNEVQAKVEPFVLEMVD